MNVTDSTKSKRDEDNTGTKRIQDKERKDDTGVETTKKRKTTKSVRGGKKTKKEDKKNDEKPNKVNKGTKKVVKRTKKIVKKTKKVVKKRKPNFLTPILEDELKLRMRYLNKRMFYCNDEDKKKSYQQHIDKLSRKVVVKC